MVINEGFFQLVYGQNGSERGVKKISDIIVGRIRGLGGGFVDLGPEEHFVLCVAAPVLVYEMNTQHIVLYESILVRTMTK